MHSVQLTHRSNAFEESLSVLNSRYADGLRLGRIQVHAPFMPTSPSTRKLQKLVTNLSNNIMMAGLLERVEDPSVLTANRARYRAIGVVLGFALVHSLPFALRIDPGLLNDLIRPSKSFVGENESNWEIIAGGFHSIVDSDLLAEFEARYPGQLLTLLRGRELDVDDFFRSVAIDGFTGDRWRIGLLRELMIADTDISRCIMTILTESDRVPLGGLGALPYRLTIADAGAIQSLTTSSTEHSLMIPRYPYRVLMRQELRRLTRAMPGRIV